MFASLAAAAHFVEPIPSTLTPVCAAISALIIGFIWRSRCMDAQEAAETTAVQPSAREGDCGSSIAWSRGAQAQPNPQLAAELAQAAALAQLTAKISHELRTPLNAVIGFSELMSRETFGPLGSQRYQNYAEHILACGQTLLKSAEDTLAITSALAEPVPVVGAASQPVLLGKLLSEARDSVSSQLLQKELLIEWEIPEEIELCGDFRVLRQVVVNLMQEAVSRSCEGMPVYVQGALEGHTVRLEFAGYQGPHGNDVSDSLAVSVARALLELHGMCLETQLDEAGCWRAVVVLDRALQQDFFGTDRAQGPMSNRVAA
jgi:His Kinase A (phospho-acceptor) domain